MYSEYTVVRDNANNSFAILCAIYNMGKTLAPTQRFIVKDGMTYDEACGSLKKLYKQ